MLRFGYLFTVCFSILFSGVKAQSAWTLQQCVDYALSHNISIKQSELNVELNKSLQNQSTLNLFPTLNGFASNNYFFGRSIDPYSNLYTENQVRSNSFSLSSSLPLFEGLQLQNTLKQSKLNHLSSKYDLEKIRNDISLNVVTDYLQVLYNKELLAVSKEQRDASMVQRDRTKKMEEVGAMSKGNVLDIESQLASDEVLLINSQSQYDQSLLALKQLLEADTIKDFSIVQPELNVPQIDAAYTNVDAIYAAALTNQPDIKSYEYKLQSAEKGLDISKGAIYPRISMNGSLSTTISTSSQTFSGYHVNDPAPVIGYTSASDTVYSIVPDASPILVKTPFNDQFNDNLGKTVGFSMSIPIFNNWNAQTNIHRAKINLKQTQLNFETAQKSMYKSIQQAVADAVSSFNKYSAGEKSVQAKEEAMKFNQQKYDVGLISTYDYLIAKNNLAKAKADLLQAKFDYIFRLKVLDFYMGKPLTF